jgi:hypothetical protein
MMAIFGTLVLGAIGAAITHYFQDRSWEHQQEAKKRDEEQKNATTLFEALSTAMDERLYAMRLAYWGIESDKYGEDEMNKRWESYRQVLYKWNNSLNKTLAMVERYFGWKIRDTLEGDIQIKFVELGGLLNQYYFEVDKRKTFDKKKFNESADNLNELIRTMNVRMISAIQEGKIGIYSPEVK